MASAFRAPRQVLEVSIRDVLTIILVKMLSYLSTISRNCFVPVRAIDPGQVGPQAPHETNFSLSVYSRAWDEVIRTTIPHLQEQLNWTASEAPISSISDLEKNNMVSQLKLSESAAPRLSVVVCTHNRYNAAGRDRLHIAPASGRVVTLGVHRRR